MLARGFLTVILLASPAVALGQNDDQALAVARDVLDRGAKLFDMRDAAAMADTYLEQSQVILIKQSSESADFEIETTSGRREIEKGYAELFKDRDPSHRSRNTVELARWLTPDLLLIQGRFALNVEQGDFLKFVQVRARVGDQWKVVTMQLMPLPQ
ncbi:hypothetical protein [Tautonia marina]|uniref:hypothetical protein n=1 Tax=Tautonia marina TaxID=2653855 RepID=UPI00126129C3|nr:hypothetical protein [Tautonia marina]